MYLPGARIATLAVVCAIACGCAREARTTALTLSKPARTNEPPHKSLVIGPPSAVISVEYSQEPSAVTPSPHQSPLDGLTTLKPQDVIALVLERNPTLDQMRATAAAAAARYPQVTSLDDPNFGFSTAPGSIGSQNANYAARVEVSQKLLYPGKRGLKGDAARADALAATEDVEDARLQLVESARSALADYYLAIKATGLAEENAKLLSEFRKNAETLFKTGKGQQQDILLADVEIARQEERLLSLRRAHLVAIARLNTLMHLPPDAPLPPPADVKRSVLVPEAARLREAALGRPDVRAAAARVAVEEAALALARKEYNPDVEVMTAYDGFWQGQGGPPLQWQVGARINLPVRYARRGGAMEEARAKVALKRAELALLTDRIGYEVQEAFERLREADAVVKLYETKVLPAADANVKEAISAYANNKIPFLNLIEAQRNRAALRERSFEAIAEAARRRAALERAIGGPLPSPDE